MPCGFTVVRSVWKPCGCVVVQLGRKQRAQRAFERFSRYEEAERVGPILRAKANAVRSPSLRPAGSDTVSGARPAQKLGSKQPGTRRTMQNAP